MNLDSSVRFIHSSMQCGRCEEFPERRRHFENGNDKEAIAE